MGPGGAGVAVVTARNREEVEHEESRIGKDKSEPHNFRSNSLKSE